MEHVFSATDDHHRMGTTVRLVHLLLVVQGISVVVMRPQSRTLHLPVLLDIHLQQNRETLGSFLPLSSGRGFDPRLHRFRVLPWLDQAVGTLHAK